MNPKINLSEEEIQSMIKLLRNRGYSIKKNRKKLILEDEIFLTLGNDNLLVPNKVRKAFLEIVDFTLMTDEDNDIIPRNIEGNYRQMCRQLLTMIKPYLNEAYIKKGKTHDCRCKGEKPANAKDW